MPDSYSCMACRNNSESIQVSYIVQIITQIAWNRYINIKITKINEYKGVYKSFKTDDNLSKKDTWDEGGLYKTDTTN